MSELVRASSCGRSEPGTAEARGEGAVGSMLLWENAQKPLVENGVGYHAARRRVERPVGMLGKEGRDLLVVLLELERTGAVDEQSTGTHDGGGGAQDGPLQRRQHGEVA